MKVQEAYNILGVSPTATPEEVKKQYRKLTKEFHPDINKDAGAEDKFKKINEAYQVVTTGKSTDPMSEAPKGRSASWNPFSNQTIQEVENINAYTNISFTDSVVGTKKEIKYSRKNKCAICNGQGVKSIDNGCLVCGGRGRTITQDKGTVFIGVCNACRGATKTEECKNCNGFGTSDVESSVHVTIPGGTVNNTILRLSGMGNFVGTFMFSMDQYTDVHLHVNVEPDSDLVLEGKNVVSKIEISLLEALRGCSKRVKTIVGYSDIEVKPKSRNGDAVIIPKLGVNRIGDHRVILDVKYPKNIDKIIDILSKEGTN